MPEPHSRQPEGPQDLSHGVVSFGPFRYEAAVGLLYRGTEEVALPPRSVAVLECFLRQPGEVLSKDDLIKAAWQGAFVAEDSLTQAISLLRQALGDDPSQPTYIQTLPRRGYRFIGTVSVVAPREDNFKKSGLRGVPRGAIFGSVVVAIALFLLWQWSTTTQSSDLDPGTEAGERIQAIAVLPLTNLSDDPEQEYFADGMTETLLTDLAKIGALKVISRTSVMQYKGASQPLKEIARQLGVDAVVEGSVLRSGNRVRITAQLIDASTDQHMWAESYERELRDILSLQREVARAIADAVKAEITPGRRGSLD